MNSTSNPELETPFGRLRGQHANGVTSFRRIPYAEAPVGPRRFEKPAAAPRWEGVLDATRPGPIPPQNPSRLDLVMGAYEAEQSEDCLHLDIWTRHAAGARAPVLVFIHGGGFMTGGGSLPCYDGSVLAGENGLVVVNISYRLGILGFWPQSDLGPPNLGLHDQIAALRWIKEAIDCFGGDPERVTVAGQSAGAFSIAAHLATDLAPSLFRRALMMSAPLGLKLRSVEQARPLAASLVDGLGLGDANELRTMPVDQIFARQRGLEGRSAGVPGDITPPFMPVLDGDLLPRDPHTTLRTGRTSECDVMIGVTREELAAFYVHDHRLDELSDDALVELFRREMGDEASAAISRIRSERVPATPRAILGDLHTDSAFMTPSLDVAGAPSGGSLNTFAYFFDWRAQASGMGACHCLDLPFLFGNFDVWSSAPMLRGAERGELEALSRVFRAAVASFVATGNPNGSKSPRWPAHSPGRVVLHLDRRITSSGYLD